MNEFNQERLQERIKIIISTLIVQKEIKNPSLSPFISVSDVHLSKDRSYATIYISSFVKDAVMEKSIIALEKAKGFIQSRISKTLNLRNTPRLNFVIDNSYADAEKINKLIDELNE